ncbi:cytidylyltransferase domain-containing protein [Streptomyces sennicomposti]
MPHSEPHRSTTAGPAAARTTSDVPETGIPAEGPPAEPPSAAARREADTPSAGAPSAGVPAAGAPAGSRRAAVPSDPAARPEPVGQGAGAAASVPRVLVVIPARGGSKGVPAKNLAPVGGVPLVARAVRECRAARLVTDVVVSTDDAAIAAAAREAGADVVTRPAAMAGDTATSEAAVLHAMDAHEALHGARVDVVLLVQCTSPFLAREDIDGVARAIVENGADTAVTVAPFHGFVWRDADDVLAGGAAAVGGGYGVNHDKSVRPRRQDRPQDLLETGAAYAMTADGFRAHRHRFFGRTELVRTDPARVLEIDDPHDLARARALAPLLDAGRRGALPTLADVDAVVLDFDGTQTDDRVLIDSDGREFVSVHRGDGLGIAALRRSGLPLLILSTEQNPVVAARARKLKLPVLHGIDRKDLALKQWCEEQGIAPERVLYVGNDVNDLPCFALVGWPVAVASAHDAVRGAARAVTTVPGGEGAVREIAGWLLGPSLTPAGPRPTTGPHSTAASLTSK